MSEITLTSSQAIATIDTKGAWITTLLGNGSDILFSRRQLMNTDGQQKLRGGCHVCLPHFGPGGESGLAQHGFGRELEWEVENQTDTLLELRLTNTHPMYAPLVAKLLYLLTDNELSMQLTLENTGSQSLPVAPAFHPYFAHAAEPVQLNGAQLSLETLAGTEFTTATDHALEIQGKIVRLASVNLPVWAVWTDQLGEYVCVEPSHSGNSFIDSLHGVPDELEQGQLKSYRFALSW